MALYRERSKFVDARQFDGKNWSELVGWADSPYIEEGKFMGCKTGDYLVRQGEDIIVIAQKDFEAKYERY